MNGRTLSSEEQNHARAALRFLRIRVGSWKKLAKALGFEASTLIGVKKHRARVSINLAYCMAKLACVPFDDVTSGRYPAPGTCPHCGRGPA
jgi:hypothetical protein